MDLAPPESPGAPSHLLDVYAQLGLEPVSAEGVHLHTADGRKILDLYGGHAVACLGFGHPRIVEALARQAAELTFQTNAVPLAVRERAALRLANFAPDGLERVFFVNSGAEANENALRVAFLAASEGKRRVVAAERAFHGRTAAASACTWGAREKWYAFPETPFPVSFVPRNDVEALTAAIDDETAVVVLEPVQGVAGAFDFSPEFLQAARARCDEVGAVLFFDEVQCGMGRSGRAFACELSGVVPDVLTTAKSLGAGFPVGAVLMTESLAEHVSKGALGTTFGGGPMACALVETVVDTIESEGLLAHVRAVSEKIRARCVVGPVESIQGAGFLLGLRCRVPAAQVRDGLLAQDILVGTSADPNVVRLMPPLTLPAPHVEELAEALAACAD